jgi:hypothetical protein
LIDRRKKGKNPGDKPHWRQVFECASTILRGIARNITKLSFVAHSKHWPKGSGNVKNRVAPAGPDDALRFPNHDRERV